MPVEVLEAAAVHEAVILFRSGVGLAAGGDGLLDNPIDAVAAVERQTEQRLDLVLRIDDPLRGEVGEVTPAQDHEDNRIRPHHRCGRARPAEARVLGEADSFVESGGLLHVGHGQVDEDHFGHRALPG